MRRTISWWMIVTAVLAVNASAIRAFLLAELRGQRLDHFDSAFLSFFTLQLGLWRYLRTTARRRRFWLGFEICGLAATVVVTYLSDTMNTWNSYTDAALELSYLDLPARLDLMLTHEHWDWFLAIIYFGPELLAAALGGLLAACLFRASEEKVATGRTHPAASVPWQGQTSRAVTAGTAVTSRWTSPARAPSRSSADVPSPVDASFNPD